MAELKAECLLRIMDALKRQDRFKAEETYFCPPALAPLAVEFFANTGVRVVTTDGEVWRNGVKIDG